jgi:RNA polymerase sigma factor (sigma-70 family)
MPASQSNDLVHHLRSALLLPERTDLTDGQLLECFVSRREPAALEALVRRHGPMVWGVCRRILHNHHDAEDAFQATFLVLVRKAASIYPRAKVGNWLYGVALQTARKGRATSAKRLAREKALTETPEPTAPEPDLWTDLQPLLDQEISRLPARYRTAFVLCELEGKTVKETAQQLGCPEGTVASRLARARAQLAQRLARHGLAVSAGSLGAVLSHKAASAAVPPALLTATIKAGTVVAAGPTTVVLSAQVTVLMEGVLKAMSLTKLKKVTGVLLVLGLIGFGAGLYTHRLAGASQTQGDERAVDGQQRSMTGTDSARAIPRKDSKVEKPGGPRRDSGGDQFQPKNIYEVDLQRVHLPGPGDMVPDPRDKKVVYYITNRLRMWGDKWNVGKHSGLYVSRDAGKTWRLLCNKFEFEKLLVHPDTDQLFAIITSEWLATDKQTGMLEHHQANKAITSTDGKKWKDITGGQGYVADLTGLIPDPDHKGQVCLRANLIRGYVLQAKDAQYTDWNWLREDRPEGQRLLKELGPAKRK